MILQFDVSFATQDIGTIITSEHGEVTRAALVIAKARGWHSTWLNEGVSIYLSRDADRHLRSYGAFPSASRIGLRVQVAQPQCLLALKLRALQAGGRDLEDVAMLARHLGLRSAEDLLAVLRANFPDEPLDARGLLVVSDISGKLA